MNYNGRLYIIEVFAIGVKYYGRSGGSSKSQLSHVACKLLKIHNIHQILIPQKEFNLVIPIVN